MGCIPPPKKKRKKEEEVFLGRRRGWLGGVTCLSRRFKSVFLGSGGWAFPIGSFLRIVGGSLNTYMCVLHMLFCI